ncbi:MAG: hypothetical protein HY816_18840 [Candidatus Wallbacteria bacterium]|nr:hypothetical protein [Candidatus Wallbacteria bacterium]
MTFVLPDAGGDLPQGYAFDCYVDDGVSRSEPAPVSLEVNPQVSRTAQLELEPGPNLLAFPVRPSDLAEPNLADVLRLTGAQFAVSMPGAAVAGGGRFRFFSRGAGGPDAVLGNEGFLVVHCGLPVSVPVRGPAWSAARQSRTLPKGLNLISYPRPCPGGETAEQLLQRTGAGFVVSTEAGSGGRSRFRVHLTGMTQPFPIRADRSYLLSMPASRVVSLPSCGP